MFSMETTKKSEFVLAVSKVFSHRLTGIISFAILTAIAAQIAFPAKPIPFTLQTMLVVLSGAFLGSRDGFYSQVFYLGLGIVGLPVFAATPEAGYGIARLFGPTGGYLLAFPLGAFLTGLIVERNTTNYYAVVIAMFLGNVVVIALGTLFLDALFIRNISESLKIGGIIFSVWTVVKVLGATAIYFGVKKTKESIK